MKTIEERKEELGGRMSFLEHLDEFRKRLVNSVIIVLIAFALCWFVSDKIYNFLAIPIRKALSEAERNDVPIKGLTGNEKILAINNLQEGDSGRYVFDRPTKLGPGLVSAGTSVESRVAKDADGNPVSLSQTARESKTKLKELNPEKAKEIQEPAPSAPGGMPFG